MTRITAAGHWRDGDPDILIVFGAGYDLTWLAWLLAALPAEVAGRVRSDDPCPGPPRVPEHPRDHALPSRCTEPGKPGPGRPPGSKNRRPATRHDVGKTVKRDEHKKKDRKHKSLNNKLR